MTTSQADLISATQSQLQAIRASSPLVHNITNYVVMNNTANALLALGASPVMAHAAEEVADIVSIASAVVVNIGTLSGPWIDAMETAMAAASNSRTPVVLDPVGMGASGYRNQTVERLIENAIPTVIRGNGSEILALATQLQATKGVDSSVPSESALTAARELSERWRTTIVISGATDYIVSPGRVTSIANGHSMMPRVTGLGCTASALVGACLAVSEGSHEAAVAAMTLMGVAGEMAARQSQGPGSFQMHFLDALYQLDANQLATAAKVNEHD